MARPGIRYGRWLMGRILRSILVLFLLLLTLFLFWRVFLSNRLPKEMRTLVPDEALHRALLSGELHPFTQEQSTLTREERNYGYFGVPRFVFVPEAGEAQVVFRYNNSTLKKVAADLGLPEALPRGEEVFDVSALLITDLTPEDTSDNTDGSETLSTRRVHPAARQIAVTRLYTYILYTFEEVCPQPDTLVVYLDVYYGENPDYSEKPLGTLRLYHIDSANEPVKLSGKEEKAIRAFTPGT